MFTEIPSLSKFTCECLWKKVHATKKKKISFFSWPDTSTLKNSMCVHV